MKRALIVLTDVLIALALLPLELLALFVPVVCLFAKWDTNRSTFTGGADYPEYPTVRGDLPRWAQVWETFDERLPGDVRMPQTRAVLDRWTGLLGERAGRYVCSVWWLLRNRMYGLAFLARQPATAYLDPVEGCIVWDGALWRYQKTLGMLRFGIGWKVHRAMPTARSDSGPFAAIPFISFKLTRRN